MEKKKLKTWHNMIGDYKKWNREFVFKREYVASHSLARWVFIKNFPEFYKFLIIVGYSDLSYSNFLLTYSCSFD